MADTFTPHYNLTLPEVGGDPDTWGDLLNGNFSALDTILWNARRLQHGQCQLRFVSATEARLYPYNGNGLVINGQQYWIPSGGIPINPPGANSKNWVVANDDGSGNIVLNFISAADAHFTWTDGVEVVDSPSNTIVGYAGTNASNQFVDTIGRKTIASWFNRRSRFLAESISPSTASTSLIPVGNGVSAFSWGGDSIYAHLMSTCSNTSGGSGVYVQLRKNGGAWSPQGSATVPGANYSVNIPVVMGDAPSAATEQENTFQAYVSVNAGTGTFAIWYMIELFI